MATATKKKSRRLLRSTDVVRMLGITHATWARWEALGMAPPPIITRGHRWWTERSIERWIESNGEVLTARTGKRKT
jgi:predicted DNA-binding transcriptional regulator AlpA